MKQANWKRALALFLSAQTISLLGSSLVQYAIIWHITLTTSSGSMLTLATVCGFLPQVCISLFAGVWIDRHSRKHMILLADAMIAVATLLLALAYLSGLQSVWLLFAVLAVRSAGTGIQTPAVSAIFPQLVPQDKLMRASALHSTLSSAILFLSPAASGLIFSLARFETVLLLDVITAVIGIGITATVRVQPHVGAPMHRSAAPPQAPTSTPTKTRPSKLTELAEGFSYLRENRFLQRLLLLQAAVLFLISPSAFLTPLMVSRAFGAEVWRLTASEMTYSLGMILGGVLMGAWGGFQKRLHTTLLAGAAYGALMIGLGAAPLFPLYLVCNALIGIASPCYNAPITVAVQEQIPAALHGRVFSLLQIVSSCALPLGMVLFGPLADIVSAQTILMLAGSAVLVLCCAAWRLRVFAR